MPQTAHVASSHKAAEYPGNLLYVNYKYSYVNELLQVEKSTLHVCITDMGLAKLKITNYSMMTNVGTMCGTPYYSAPETFHGDVGKPLDIWSLGIVLLELFSRRHAWGSGGEYSEESAMMYLSPKWKTICLQCIAYEPYDRNPIEEILQATLNYRTLRGRDQKEKCSLNAIKHTFRLTVLY